MHVLLRVTGFGDHDGFSALKCECGLFVGYFWPLLANRVDQWKTLIEIHRGHVLATMTGDKDGASTKLRLMELRPHRVEIEDQSPYVGSYRSAS